jgi:hypothetical protein
MRQLTGRDDIFLCSWPQMSNACTARSTLRNRRAPRVLSSLRNGIQFDRPFDPVPA